MRKKSLPFGPPKIHFPEDEGAHPEFLAEWWYGNFSLTDSGGREYGATAAYFNFGLKILAISDLEAERLYHVVSGSALHHAEGFFELRWGGRDHWFRTDPDSFSYHLESYGPEIGFNLALVSEKPPLLGCGNGLVRWTGGRSYYYSLTRLRAKGQIELSGRMIDVEGIGMMDHQWMNYMGKGGWDWFCVQLENETEIVFWRIVNPDESVKSRDLTIMFPDNSVHHTRDLVLERMDSWVSPESGREYGVLWRVREEVHDLDLEIRARYAQQEIRMFEALSGPTFPFWEGSMAVSGHLGGEAVCGTGCAELVRPPSSDW
jgi:predicted secreted hydrolase